jgi:hypothetical protein
VLQALSKRLGSAETEGIDAGATQSAIEFSKAVGVGSREFLTHYCTARIDFEQLTGFSIFDSEQPRGWEETFPRVVQMNAHEVVAGIGEADFLQGITSGWLR